MDDNLLTTQAGTKAQRHRGTKAQRHKGAKGQRGKGTKKEEQIGKKALCIFLGAAAAFAPMNLSIYDNSN